MAQVGFTISSADRLYAEAEGYSQNSCTSNPTTAASSTNSFKFYQANSSNSTSGTSYTKIGTGQCNNFDPLTNTSTKCYDITNYGGGTVAVTLYNWQSGKYVLVKYTGYEGRTNRWYRVGGDGQLDPYGNPQASGTIINLGTLSGVKFAYPGCTSNGACNYQSYNSYPSSCGAGGSTCNFGGTCGCEGNADPSNNCCDNNLSPDGEGQDCNGICGGPALVDQCGECIEDGTTGYNQSCTGCTTLGSCNYGINVYGVDVGDDILFDDGSCYSPTDGCTCDDPQGSTLDACGNCRISGHINEPGDGLPDTNNDGVYMDWCGCCGPGTEYFLTLPFQEGAQCTPSAIDNSEDGTHPYCGSNTDNNCCDCNGTINGSAELDDCNQCDGGNQECVGENNPAGCPEVGWEGFVIGPNADCSGICFGSNQINNCGDCVGPSDYPLPSPPLPCPDGAGVDGCATLTEGCVAAGLEVGDTPGVFIDSNDIGMCCDINPPLGCNLATFDGCGNCNGTTGVGDMCTPSAGIVDGCDLCEDQSTYVCPGRKAFDCPFGDEPPDVLYMLEWLVYFYDTDLDDDGNLDNPYYDFIFPTTFANLDEWLVNSSIDAITGDTIYEPTAGRINIDGNLPNTKNYFLYENCDENYILDTDEETDRISQAFCQAFYYNDIILDPTGQSLDGSAVNPTTLEQHARNIVKVHEPLILDKALDYLNNPSNPAQFGGWDELNNGLGWGDYTTDNGDGTTRSDIVEKMLTGLTTNHDQNSDGTTVNYKKEVIEKVDSTFTGADYGGGAGTSIVSQSVYNSILSDMNPSYNTYCAQVHNITADNPQCICDLTSDDATSCPTYCQNDTTGTTDEIYCGLVSTILNAYCDASQLTNAEIENACEELLTGSPSIIDCEDLQFTGGQCWNNQCNSDCLYDNWSNDDTIGDLNFYWFDLYGTICGEVGSQGQCTTLSDYCLYNQCGECGLGDCTDDLCPCLDSLDDGGFGYYEYQCGAPGDNSCYTTEFANFVLSNGGNGTVFPGFDGEDVVINSLQEFCEFSDVLAHGCTYPGACNYNSLAVFDTGCCLFPESDCHSCATVITGDAGECPSLADDADCLCDIDCAGNCNGSLLNSEFGIEACFTKPLIGGVPVWIQGIEDENTCICGIGNTLVEESHQCTFDESEIISHVCYQQYNEVINICQDSNGNEFQGERNQFGNIGIDICGQCGGSSTGLQNEPFPCQDHYHPIEPGVYCNPIENDACGCPTCIDLTSTNPEDCCVNHGGTYGTIPNLASKSELIYELFDLYDATITNSDCEGGDADNDCITVEACTETFTNVYDNPEQICLALDVGGETNVIGYGDLTNAENQNTTIFVTPLPMPGKPKIEQCYVIDGDSATPLLIDGQPVWQDAPIYDACGICGGPGLVQYFVDEDLDGNICDPSQEPPDLVCPPIVSEYPNEYTTDGGFPEYFDSGYWVEITICDGSECGDDCNDYGCSEGRYCNDGVCQDWESGLACSCSGTLDYCNNCSADDGYVESIQGEPWCGTGEPNPFLTSCCDCSGTKIEVDVTPAYINECGTCVCGDVQTQSCNLSSDIIVVNCIQGCNGVYQNDGTHTTIDLCGTCDGGIYVTDDCLGDDGLPIFPNGCCDCSGVPNGDSYINTCGDCVTQETDNCVQGCDGEWAQSGSEKTLDECGVCGGDNSNCLDCAGTPNGTATEDCAGVCNGLSLIDVCGVCNSPDNYISDPLDCEECPIGYDRGCDDNCYLEGSDELLIGGVGAVNQCGTCSGINLPTGEEYCGAESSVANCCDCAGVPNGTAVKDCNNDCNGIAFIDECGTCSGGNSEHEPNSEQDCSEQCPYLFNDETQLYDASNPAYIGTQTIGDVTYVNGVDECGVCHGDNSACTDCAGVVNGDSSYDLCGICNLPNEGSRVPGIPYCNHQDCQPDSDGVYDLSCDVSCCDCAGNVICNQNVLDYGIGDYCIQEDEQYPYQFDECRNCHAKNEEACEQDCAGVWGGNSLLDYCNNCLTPQCAEGGPFDDINLGLDENGELINPCPEGQYPSNIQWNAACSGCMDDGTCTEIRCGYDSSVTNVDGDIISACNYGGSNITIDNGSCYYPVDEHRNCDGICYYDSDGDNICDGQDDIPDCIYGWLDVCGTCGGPGLNQYGCCDVYADPTNDVANGISPTTIQNNGCGCNNIEPTDCPDNLTYGCGGLYCSEHSNVTEFPEDITTIYPLNESSCESNTYNGYCDCDGNVQGIYCDCDGNVLDACGVCGGTCPEGSTDCIYCDGTNYDVCNLCAGCDGVPNSGAVLDSCGVCYGGTTDVLEAGTTLDCFGVCDGDNIIDDCGVCSCPDYATIPLNYSEYGLSYVGHSIADTSTNITNPDGGEESTIIHDAAGGNLTNTQRFRFGYRFKINENGEGVWDNENLYLHDDSIPLNVPNLQYEKEYTFSTMIYVPSGTTSGNWSIQIKQTCGNNDWAETAIPTNSSYCCTPEMYSAGTCNMTDGQANAYACYAGCVKKTDGQSTGEVLNGYSVTLPNDINNSPRDEWIKVSGTFTPQNTDTYGEYLSFRINSPMGEGDHLSGDGNTLDTAVDDYFYVYGAELTSTNSDIINCGFNTHVPNSDKDCNGDCFGTAFIDDCGVCSEGNSGHVANSDKDDCLNCFGTFSQENPLVPYCGGDGTEENNCCDCEGIPNGSAFIDECGVCSGGTTENIPNQDKDLCGTCFGDNTVCDEGCGPNMNPPVYYWFDEDNDMIPSGIGTLWCTNVSDIITNQTCNYDSENQEITHTAGTNNCVLPATNWLGYCQNLNTETNICEADELPECPEGVELDCAGICGGDAEDLGCGCNEPAPSGCDEQCGSTAELDICGVCDGPGPQEPCCDGTLVCNASTDCSNIICGCMDETACNYNQNATVDNIPCEFPEEFYNCEGLYCVDGIIGCDNICNSGLVLDVCGVCDGNGIPDGACDCDGNVLDVCGVCGGSGYNEFGCCGDATSDCLGTCSNEDGYIGNVGNNGVDFCGVCGGQSLTNDPYCGLTSSTSCCDCNGDPYGLAFEDDCGICSGGNSGHVQNSEQDCLGNCPSCVEDNSCIGSGYLGANGGGIDDCGFCDGGTFNAEGVFCTYCADYSIPDCAGYCSVDDPAYINECGTCLCGDSTEFNCQDEDPDCVADCNGVVGGDSVIDVCGVCNGPGDIYECGCTGLPEGACDCDGNVLDACGECGGPGLTHTEEGCQYHLCETSQADGSIQLDCVCDSRDCPNDNFEFLQGYYLGESPFGSPTPNNWIIGNPAVNLDTWLLNSYGGLSEDSEFSINNKLSKVLDIYGKTKFPSSQLSGGNTEVGSKKANSAALLIEIDEGDEFDYTIFNNVLYSDEQSTNSLDWEEFDVIASVIGNQSTSIIYIGGVWYGDLELKSGMGLIIFTNHNQAWIKFDI